MPRKSRTSPGSRPYANRTDRLTAVPSPPAGPTQAVSTPTGQPYGAAGALARSQAAVPLPSQPGIDTAALHQAASDHQFSPVPGGLDGQSMRPHEPVTAGLGMGAGPGPEAIQPINAPRAPDPLVAGAAILNTIGDQANPEVRRLRDYVNAQLGNQGAV